jgi:hypothetical protein
MHIENVEIYSDQSYAVVLRHLGRKFPGILIQGDTLHALCTQAADGYAASESLDPGARDELLGLRDSLSALLAHYKDVLGEHQIALPFVEAAGA